MISAQSKHDEPAGEPSAGIIRFLRVTDLRVFFDVFQKGVEMEDREPTSPEGADVQSVSFLDEAPVFVDPIADENPKTDDRQENQTAGWNVKVDGL